MTSSRVTAEWLCTRCGVDQPQAGRRRDTTRARRPVRHLPREARDRAPGDAAGALDGRGPALSASVATVDGPAPPKSPRPTRCPTRPAPMRRCGPRGWTSSSGRSRSRPRSRSRSTRRSSGASRSTTRSSSARPGLGKTTLAMLMAREMGVQLRTSSGPVLEKPGDLVGLLTSLGAGRHPVHRRDPPAASRCSRSSSIRRWRTSGWTCASATARTRRRSR